MAYNSEAGGLGRSNYCTSCAYHSRKTRSRILTRPSNSRNMIKEFGPRTLQESYFLPIKCYSLYPTNPEDLIECSPGAVDHLQHFRVIPDFASQVDEQNVLKEISRTMRRKMYQYDHWDGVRIMIPCSIVLRLSHTRQL